MSENQGTLWGKKKKQNHSNSNNTKTTFKHWEVALCLFAFAFSLVHPLTKNQIQVSQNSEKENPHMFFVCLFVVK